MTRTHALTKLAPNTCPRCLGGIPNNDQRGAYPGALSRTDHTTHVCSECGLLEAIEQFTHGHVTQADWLVNSQYWCAICDQPIVNHEIERRHSTVDGYDCHSDCCDICQTPRGNLCDRDCLTETDK